MSDLERYLHTDDGLPGLVRAGLVHAQFETIHPYLDGNGRVGRLLITLCLEDWGLLAKPLLYLSTYFKRHQQPYYNSLNAIRTEGNWEGWIEFFLRGVALVSNEATNLFWSLFDLVDQDRRRVVRARYATLMSLRLFDRLPEMPIVTINSVMKLCDTSHPTATKAVQVLVRAGVLEETTGKRRDRNFGYREYLDRLREGTELVA